MKIKIKKDAKHYYVALCNAQKAMCNHEWCKTLEKVQGLTLDVETDYLFDDQFNTAPVPGVSELGLRMMDYSVEEVIDDERIGKMKCQWCGTTSPVGPACAKCGKTDSLKAFHPRLYGTVWEYASR